MESKSSRDNSVVLILGGVFLFCIVRAFVVVTHEAWMLLLLPAGALPVYFYGRMFFCALAERLIGGQVRNTRSGQWRKRFSESEHTFVAAAFFVLPVIIAGGVLYFGKDRSGSVASSRIHNIPQGNAGTFSIPQAPQIEPKSKLRLSTGLTEDEVFALLGRPTKIQAGIWYYGESFVWFINGKVASLVESPRSPLMVRGSPGNPPK